MCSVRGIDTERVEGADGCPGEDPHVLPEVGLLRGADEEPRPRNDVTHRGTQLVSGRAGSWTALLPKPVGSLQPRRATHAGHPLAGFADDLLISGSSTLRQSRAYFFWNISRTLEYFVLRQYLTFCKKVVFQHCCESGGC